MLDDWDERDEVVAAGSICPVPALDAASIGVFRPDSAVSTYCGAAEVLLHRETQVAKYTVCSELADGALATSLTCLVPCSY